MNPHHRGGDEIEKFLTWLRVERGRATGVMTAAGPVRARTVVICGGMWSRELAAQAGVRKSWGRDFDVYTTNNTPDR